MTIVSCFKKFANAILKGLEVIIVVVSGLTILKAYFLNENAIGIGAAFILLAFILILVVLYFSRVPRSLFACEKIEFFWGISERGGSTISKTKRMLVSLASNQKFYELRGLYTNGEVTKMSIEGAASIIPIYGNTGQGGKYRLVVEFYQPLRKGEKVEFSIIKESKNTFLNSNEYVEVGVIHETKEMIIRVELPEERPLKKWYGTHYHGQSPQLFDKREIRERREDGKVVIEWRRDKRILLNDNYYINWEW